MHKKFAEDINKVSPDRKDTIMAQGEIGILTVRLKNTEKELEKAKESMRKREEFYEKKIE